MAMDRVTVLAVAAQAHAAVAAGKTEEDCPYDANGGPEQRFRARYWKLAFEEAEKAQEDSAGR
ncbi:hypothetical protein [Streptomyces sp. NPDC001536]|uniref:hypothetical protein n=1 Tax=Streptomyces sp. NPDC001536 TaxID=3364583 RepID=UPI0036A401E1